MFVRLKVLKGKCKAGKKKLSAKRYLIGQSEDCHIRPDGADVSPMHCEIVVSSLGAKVRDLDSASGTKLNGEPLLQAQDLESGDVVAVGDVEFMVLLMREGDDTARPATKEERAVTDWIEEADEEAREARRSNPDGRQFTVPTPITETAVEDVDEKQALLDRLRNQKKEAPKKLPVEPLQTESSVLAADEILKKLMTPPKPPNS